MTADAVPIVNAVLRALVATEGAFIVAGHLFVLGLFYQQGARGRLSNYHLISLMVSDLMQGLLNVPLVMYLTGDLRVGDPSCFWAHWLTGTSGMTQIFIILAVTLDRYWAIVHPIHYKANATVEKTFALIALGWGCGLTLGIIALFLRVTPDDPSLMCVFSEQLLDANLIAIVVTLLILPSNIVIAVLYVKIYRVIIKSVREFAPAEVGTVDKIRRIMSRGASISDIPTSTISQATNNNSPESTPPRDKEHFREYRTMLILSMLVSLYFIGWIPSPIFYVFLKLKKIPLTMYLLAALLNFLHSALNPLIYVLNIRERKVAARKLVGKLLCRN